MNLSISSPSLNVPPLFCFNNRIIFLNVLDQLIDILQVKQCIIISHNTEMDISNCDIIQLKLASQDNINTGNIIYKY